MTFQYEFGASLKNHKIQNCDRVQTIIFCSFFSRLIITGKRYIKNLSIAQTYGTMANDKRMAVDVLAFKFKSSSAETGFV